MGAVKHLTMAELEAGLAEIRRSPRDEGALMLIVRRPRTLEREVLERGELDLELGLVGDNWQARGSSMTDDGAAHPEMQLNLMNARAIDLIAGDKNAWHVAGDQLFVAWICPAKICRRGRGWRLGPRSSKSLRCRTRDARSSRHDSGWRR